MSRIITEFFSEIHDAAVSDIENLELQKHATLGQGVPTAQERSAIERVQALLKQLVENLREELAALE